MSLMGFAGKESIVKDEHSSEQFESVNDNNAPDKSRTLLTDIVMGVRFYSQLPISAIEHKAPVLSHMAPALPFVGLIIGIGPALALVACSYAGMPPLFAATLAVAFWAFVTGAMAEDAIADAADGLFGGKTVAQRLKILKDSRHGTYGVTSLVLYVALRIFALGSIVATSPLAAACLWLAATVLSRSGALWLTLKLPPARQDGASASSGRVSLSAFSAGLAFAIILSFVLAAPFAGIASLLAAIIFMCAITLGWTRLCLRMAGGQTGDLIGALQVLLEIAALSVFIINVGP